jgi:hypothetical protein
MMKIKLSLLLVFATSILHSCKEQKTEVSTPSEEFKKTWYDGKAELSSYTLQQARYGEIRNGEAALIFVTEDFSADKLVKLDEPETENKVKVLKMNMTKTFATGIYPYSMMLSVFKPVSADGNEKTLKANCSSQEWCGQTFSQLHLKADKYNWQLHSYFESEVEKDKSLDAVLLEDELWNHIRMNPSALPQGKVRIIPGLLWQRLSHIDLGEQEAVISLSKADTSLNNNDEVQLYTIQYPKANRTLQIYFEAFFPYEILGWKETYPDGFGNNKRMLTTTAVRKKTIRLDYWKHNANIDSTYRDTLQLKRYE